jgi:hypothetical protein
MVRWGGRARQRAKGKLSRSFFLLRLSDCERVRVLEEWRGAGWRKDVDVLIVWSRGSRGGANDRGDVGEGVQGRQGRSFQVVFKLESKGVVTRGGQGTKGLFGRVLELEGCSATGRE